MTQMSSADFTDFADGYVRASKTGKSLQRHKEALRV